MIDIFQKNNIERRTNKRLRAKDYIGSRTSNVKRQNGFTLLEILISLSIAGIIFFTVFAVYSNTLTLTENFNTYFKINQMAQTIMDITYQDIQSAYYKKADNSTKENFKFTTTSTLETIDDNKDSRLVLSMATTNDLTFDNIFPCMTINQVQYFLKKNNELFSLIRKQKSSQQTKWHVLEIADNIQEFSLLFLNKEGQEFEDWDSENNEFYGSVLPCLVKLTLRIKEENNFSRKFVYFIPVEGWSVHQ